MGTGATTDATSAAARSTATGSKAMHERRRRELAGMCETLSTYSDADWDHDTYCTGWRVRDVVGHMLAGYTTPMPTMLAKVASHRFNVDKASAVESVAL